MTSEMSEFLDDLVSVCPEIHSIWLIGSRANGTATDVSDWDFLAFGSAATLTCLKRASALHRNDIDFLVITNGEDFENAWGAKEATGSLSEWHWKPISSMRASYTESKLRDDEEGERVVLNPVVQKERNAIRVWPK